VQDGLLEAETIHVKLAGRVDPTARCTWPTTASPKFGGRRHSGRDAPADRRSGRGRAWTSRLAVHPTPFRAVAVPVQLHTVPLRVGESRRPCSRDDRTAGKAVAPSSRPSRRMPRGRLPSRTGWPCGRASITRARMHELGCGTRDDPAGSCRVRSHRVGGGSVGEGRQHGQRHGIAVVGGHPVEVGDGRVTAPIEVSAARGQSAHISTNLVDATTIPGGCPG
jgi:hypothetical protein